ncbi:VOC family protein [Mycolicibacter algericus]|uniref:Iron-dependent extradiol dioxygenase n=2 Tax=Mycolicibacter algericus TaxID=1288388 RepID=A0A7I9YAF6_MYCAL|nr:VOC family protein [Mycolicibacter algericus]GFG85607.1 iron-dependent extradiol dioxygenase [Mycolicibacter algericus]GFG87926.1 iron-dependent extradiol dioxygenase [Mycolicibacter algericus]
MELGYVGLEVSDPAAFGGYLADVLGLMPGRPAADQVSTWRMDDKVHRLVVESGEADDVVYAGFLVADRAEFDASVARLHDAGFDATPGSVEEITARRVEQMVYVTAPWGVRIEIARGLRDADEPFLSPLQPGGFLTGDLGMGHVVFWVSGGRAEFEAADAFVVKALGLKLSDWLEIEMGGLPVSANFYHCNGRHHSLACVFVPVPELPKKLDHIMIETVSMDNVGHAYDRALKANCSIARDLGKHPNDRMFSFYSAGPGGVQFELGADAVTVNDDWEVVRYDQISAWGHHPGGATKA